MNIQQESVSNTFERVVIQRNICDVNLHDLQVTTYKPDTITTCCLLSSIWFAKLISVFVEKPRCPETRAEFGRDVFVDLNRWGVGSLQISRCISAFWMQWFREIDPYLTNLAHKSGSGAWNADFFPTKNKPGKKMTHKFWWPKSHHLDSQAPSQLRSWGWSRLKLRFYPPGN